MACENSSADEGLPRESLKFLWETGRGKTDPTTEFTIKIRTKLCLELCPKSNCCYAYSLPMGKEGESGSEQAGMGTAFMSVPHLHLKIGLKLLFPRKLQVLLSCKLFTGHA